MLLIHYRSAERDAGLVRAGVKPHSSIPLLTVLGYEVIRFPPVSKRRSWRALIKLPSTSPLPNSMRRLISASWGQDLPAYPYLSDKCRIQRSSSSDQQ